MFIAKDSNICYINPIIFKFFLINKLYLTYVLIILI